MQVKKGKQGEAKGTKKKHKPKDNGMGRKGRDRKKRNNMRREGEWRME
jgi:hypothetical protein